MEKLNEELSKTEDPSVVEREIKASLDAVKVSDTALNDVPGKSDFLDSRKN